MINVLPQLEIAKFNIVPYGIIVVFTVYVTQYVCQFVRRFVSRVVEQ